MLNNVFSLTPSEKRDDKINIRDHDQSALFQG